jgi:sugar phosphate isomerase/epimerase
LISTGIGCHECRIGDLDGDGDLDILQKDFQHDRRVDVWLDNGARQGACGVGTSASFHGPVGLQLYSLRDIFKDDVPLGLQFSRDFGFVEVELAGTYGLTPAQFRQRLGWYGLKPIGGHWSYEQWANNPEAVVKEAKALGLPYAGCAWIPHEGPFDEAACRRAAAVFNRAGRAAAAQGIKFYYHNHGYEFVPHGDGTLFDLLVRETDPELVAFEMDVFWTVHPGQDPVQLLRRYPKRWELFHIKDLRKGVQTGKLTGSEDVRNDVTLGTGQIDLSHILNVAQQIGVKHYFIEDESPSAVEQIPQSLKFLESLSW